MCYLNTLSLAPSMLTLWVGLASGFVAAYGVNVLKVPAAKFPGAGQAAKTPGVGPAKTPGVGKRIELMPTREYIIHSVITCTKYTV